MITDMKDAKIFSPLQLGRTTLKNRIAMAPMSMHYEATNGTVPKQLADIFVRRAEGGAGYDEVIAWGEANKLKIAHRFTVDDLNYLKAGGRVSNAAALVGGMLAIKPVLYVPDAGTLDVAKKVRGRKTAVNSILDSAKADLAEVDTNGLKVHILQADCRADAEYVRDELKKAYPDLGEITITSLGVVIGAHCGPGLLTVFYLCNSRRP